MENQQVKRKENRQVKRRKSGCKLSIKFPEEILIDIMARLPLRSIMRLKTVCKGWKRLIMETVYFRGKFMFAHRNSSSSWSIMHATKSGWSYGEVVGSYGCERYGIPRSLDSYLPSHELVGQITIIACVDGLVLLEDTSGEETIHKVGNPVLNQWVQLPPHPSKGINGWVRPTSLVTRVEDDVVVEYKVVFMDGKHGLHEVEALSFEIYSSEIGTWIRKRVICPRIVSLDYRSCMSLNKKLHWVDEHRGGLITYDFFVDDEQQQQCQLIPFPDGETDPLDTRYERAYSTSGGFLVFISNINFGLKVWRFEEYTSDSGRWQLMQDINLKIYFDDIGEINYFPVAMHPFKNHIIYMCTWERNLVSIDLKTHKLKPHPKSTFSVAMLSRFFHRDCSFEWVDRLHKVFYVPQFILPKWMGSVPSLRST